MINLILSYILIAILWVISGTLLTSESKVFRFFGSLFFVAGMTLGLILSFTVVYVVGKFLVGLF